MPGPTLADYWIVNLPERRLEIYREPEPDATAPFGLAIPLGHGSGAGRLRITARSTRSAHPDHRPPLLSPSLGLSGLCTLVGEEVGEVDQVLVSEPGQLLRHGSAVAEPGAALVLPHGLEQVLLPLIGQARHLLAAGEIRLWQTPHGCRRVSVRPRAKRAGSGASSGGGGGGSLVTRSAKAVRSSLVSPLAAAIMAGLSRRPSRNRKSWATTKNEGWPPRTASRGSGLAVGAVAGQAHREPLVDALGVGHAARDEERQGEEAESGAGRERSYRPRPAARRHFL